MTVIRELIAKLGFQVDSEGWRKAERAVEELKRATAVLDARVKQLGPGFDRAGASAARTAANMRAAAGGVAGVGVAASGASARLAPLLAQLMELRRLSVAARSAALPGVPTGTAPRLPVAGPSLRPAGAESGAGLLAPGIAAPVVALAAGAAAAGAASTAAASGVAGIGAAAAGSSRRLAPLLSQLEGLRRLSAASRQGAGGAFLPPVGSGGAPRGPRSTGTALALGDRGGPLNRTYGFRPGPRRIYAEGIPSPQPIYARGEATVNGAPYRGLMLGPGRVPWWRRGATSAARSAGADGTGVAAVGGAIGGAASRAATGIGRTMSGGSGVGGLVAAVGLGAAVHKMLELASAANETENVLGQVFGAKGLAAVKAWADTTSKEVGRSKYTLRDYAGQLGAMLEPMTGSATKAQEMSTTFAKLAVDLASFFNTSDEDALAALKSGIAGETEPLRRYGIVLLDATLQEFAHKQGIRKKISAMTEAEKVELRYQFMLSRTTKAQGDAARTADGYANSSKRLKESVKDLSTTLGRQLLPDALRVVNWASDAASAFDELAKGTSIAEGAVGALGTVLAVVNASKLVAWTRWGITLGLIALALDEIITTAKGGDTIIRGLYDTTQAPPERRADSPEQKAAREGWIGDFLGAVARAMGNEDVMTHMLGVSEPVSPSGARPGQWSMLPAPGPGDAGYGVMDPDRLFPKQFVAPYAPPPSAAQVSNVTVNNGPINVNLYGNTSADAARAAKRAADTALRQTAAALSRTR